MTIRLDPEVLKIAKVRAAAEKRTLTNYIETLIRKDLAKGTRPLDLHENAPVTVFLAEPLTERLTTDPHEGDTPDDVARRQEYT